MHPLMDPHSKHNMLHASRYMCDNVFTDDCEMSMIAQAYLPQTNTLDKARCTIHMHIYP